MFLFRKGERSDHEIHCQAAVKKGNKFFKLTNCDGRQIATGEIGYAEKEWREMFGFKRYYKFLKTAEAPEVEYFKTG